MDHASKQPKVTHMVYFTLKESSDANRQRLVASCNQFLAGHDGALYFSSGTRVPDLMRDVNDRDFDVGLHLIFASREDHDRYQTHPRHLEFIAQNKATWKTVRVFDSYVK